MRLAGAGAGLALATVLVLAVLTTQSAQAQVFTVLASFDGTNGVSPAAGLVQATNGKLYGTAAGGGVNSGGNVFEVTTSGTLTPLYSFCSQANCADGKSPQAGLVQATNGKLYGTTVVGGANSEGTVFEISPSGLTTLYSFCTQVDCTDGAVPAAGLVQDTNGDLYGTTTDGGANNQGTVFKITPAGALTTLYSFCALPSCRDGAAPSAGLVQATNGDLYGTTSLGGVHKGGLVFKITPAGKLTTFYNFCSLPSCSDGEEPLAGLIQGSNGDLYGTTSTDGVTGGGSVYEITLSGKLTTLYRFCSLPNCADGADPTAGLIQATDGNFYGTTLRWGANEYGTVFEITPAGNLTTLYSFCALSSCSDGQSPGAGLIQDTNGTFYGTTESGGAISSGSCSDLVGGCGTVFSLSVGLGPFVETQTTSGKVGAAVKILGTDLTGATSVTFNGEAAAFTVVSGSEITTKVPTGAASGPVVVVTPGGTLTSNVIFRVT
jgi:uncharacterized repeat protein (TIGR03803 family)